MIRTQISLSGREYDAAKREARRLGVSLAELLRRSLRTVLPADASKPWMRYAGMIETGDSEHPRRSTNSFMGRRTEAYVDTSALIAFLDRSDSYHAQFRRLFGEPPALITTTLVAAEGHGWFLRRYDRSRALQFLSFVEDLKPLHMIPVGPDEHVGGVRMLRRFSDQDLTLTDAVGLHVMKSRNIASCWSTDFHLGLTGIPLVINER